MDGLEDARAAQQLRRGSNGFVGVTGERSAHVRFLQKRGVGILTAVAGAGLISLAGAGKPRARRRRLPVAAGSHQGLPFHLPKAYIIILVVTLALIAVGVLLWIPRTGR